MAVKLHILRLMGAGLLAAAITVPIWAPTAAAAQSGDGVRRERPRISVSPRHRYLPPHAKRACESWLQKEYRVSGTVIVPMMRCRWVY
jgi:hypothetical protein